MDNTIAGKTLKTIEQMNTDEVTKMDTLSRITPSEVVPEKLHDPLLLENGSFEFQNQPPPPPIDRKNG